MEDLKENLKDIKDKTEDIVDHIEGIADTFYKLTMVNMTQKATNIASGTVAVLAICVFGLFVLFFGGMALAWWLGDLINSRTGGFLLAAAFFLIITVIVVAYRKKIVFPFIRDLIIRKIYE
jgi:hypothetical protein